MGELLGKLELGGLGFAGLGFWGILAVPSCDIRIRGGGGAGMEEADGEGLPGWGLAAVGPQVGSAWRSGVRSAMRAASQLPGKGMWMMHLHVNQKSDYDYDMILKGEMPFKMHKIIYFFPEKK